MIIGIDDTRNDIIRNFSILIFENKEKINNLINDPIFKKIKEKCSNNKFKSRYIIKHIKRKKGQYKDTFSEEEVKNLIKLIKKYSQYCCIVKFPETQNIYHEKNLKYYSRWKLIRDIVLMKQCFKKINYQKCDIHICNYDPSNMAFIRRIIIKEFNKISNTNPQVIIKGEKDCLTELIDLADLYKCANIFTLTEVLNVDNITIIKEAQELIKNCK
jgi:hypothetical protein